MVEMPQVGELVTEGVDEARILQGTPARDVAESNFDRSVGVANAITALDIGPLGFQSCVAQSKAFADAVCILAQSTDQFAGDFSIHFPTDFVRPGRPSQVGTPEWEARYTSSDSRKQGRAMREQTPETIPIFPLGNVVLFPGTHVPLHIFEPRYREMTQAAIQSDRKIGMIAVRPEQRSQMSEDPELFPIGCAGMISQAEEQPDGTWNLLLTATQRFRVVAEPPRPADRGYRTAQVQYLEEKETDQPLAELRSDICARLEEILRRMTPAGEVQPTLEKLSELDDPTLVCSLAQGLDFGVLEKQRLLEAGGLKTRATILSDLLQFRIAEIETLSSPGIDQIQ